MNLFAQNNTILSDIEKILEPLKNYDAETKIDIINNVKILLHKLSPLKNEPVDCVIWIKNEFVYANDYNPNSVAPPEMKLLEHSIMEDGYTQPIVTFVEDEGLQVIDGFHRNRIGKESEKIKTRCLGYLPIVRINEWRTDRSDRISATIRHNRARGKHRIDAMANIVIELKRRNWSDEKIGRELGMDADEVLRLTQITGLAEMFSDQEFSKSWEVGQINEDDNLDINFEQVI